MKFGLKIGIMIVACVAVPLMLIPPVSWYFPIALYVQYGFVDEQRGFGLEYMSDEKTMEKNQHSDSELKFVELTDTDFEDVVWLGELIRNNPKEDSAIDISLQDWNNYVKWIRERYQQQFGETLENSWVVHMEYAGMKYKAVFYR